MLEALGLPTDGLKPLLAAARIEVDRRLLRDFYRGALEASERRVVAALVDTYQAWHDANLEIIRELGLEAAKAEKQSSGKGDAAE